MLETISQPWPWYVAGPLIGLMVPLLILLKRRFGISTSLRHACAAAAPRSASFFDYDWRNEGGWNLVFVGGVLLGSLLSAVFLPGPDSVAISESTHSVLADLGLTDFTGLAPSEIFAWSGLATPGGFLSMVVGGFLVGFGARVAGGCTSGHAISGMAELRKSSMVVVIGFFAGGLTITYLVLPFILGGLR